MYDPYEDEALVEFLEKASHGELESEFMDLMRKHVNLKKEYKQLVSNIAWERTTRV